MSAVDARASRFNPIPLIKELLPDVDIGLQNLLLHKLRSLLTMLGIIFGVAAVIAMLSIGAGARAQAMAFIEQLGVRNLIIEAKESTSWDDLQKVRKDSPGLTLKDYRIIQASASNVLESTPRKRFTPSKLLPKPQGEMPLVFGVKPNYRKIATLRIEDGRFFDEDESSVRCGRRIGRGGARQHLGQEDAIGKYVKINDNWLRVIGVVWSADSSGGAIEGVPSQDLNNLIYVPVNTAVLRLEDNRSGMKDEIDGIYLQLKMPMRVLTRLRSCGAY